MHRFLLLFFISYLGSLTTILSQIDSSEFILIPTNTNNIIDGYTDKKSYFPGDTIQVFVNANRQELLSKIFVLTIDQQVEDSVYVRINSQSAKEDKPWEDFGYKPSFFYVVPKRLKSGMYSFDNKIYFIVKNKKKDAEITIIYPTNTEEAYNNAGGKSLYDFNSSGKQRAYIVGFKRPLSAYILEEIQLHCRPFLEWLQTEKKYSIQYISDQDMDDYSEIQKSKLIIAIGHSEYWTRKARLNFDRFVNEGKDAGVFSGNTMWWQVRYSSKGDQLVCYKDILKDTIKDTLLRTINWTEPSLDYSVLHSIGCHWPDGAYGMKGVYGNRGYKITTPDSPLLSGTGLDFHDILSCESYEYDSAPLLGFDEYGDPILDRKFLDFCNIELIGYDIGKGVDAPKYKGYGTFVVFQKNYKSGTVVNTAFNTFTGKTPTYGNGGVCGPDAAKIRKIILNIFDLMKERENVFSNPFFACKNNDVLEVNLRKIENLVYPNPTSGIVNIKLELNPNEQIEFLCYNLLGELQVRKILDESQLYGIDLSSLSEGIYVYKVIRNKKLVQTDKLIILHPNF